MIRRYIELLQADGTSVFLNPEHVCSVAVRAEAPGKCAVVVGTVSGSAFRQIYSDLDTAAVAQDEILLMLEGS